MIHASQQPLNPALRLPLARLEAALGLGDTASAECGPVEGPVNESALEAAARALVGLGPGLTPSGDDVLVGLLLGLGTYARLAADGAAGPVRSAHRVISAVASSAGSATTAVSAALLTHAAEGEGMPVVLDLLTALTAPSPPGHTAWDGAGTPQGGAPPQGAGAPDALTAATASVIAVGHQTGAALLYGVALASQLAAAPSTVTIPA